MSGRVLVIAEKPSVAKNIANAIGAYKEHDGYLEGRDWIVSWCLGHLAEYALPETYDQRYSKWEFEDLPIIPDPWRMTVSKDKKKQYELLKEIMHREDLTSVVNACDAGREGELIFRRVFDLAGCELPVGRLWISSMEVQAIRDGLNNIQSGHDYDDLADASVCRSQADWLIGINESRAFTTTYGRRLILGRVQTPTLAMLVEREKEIENFQREPFYLVHIKGDGLDAVSEQFSDRKRADEISASCSGQDAYVKEILSEEKKVYPPKLYDLTTLQREANRYFGITAGQTLEAAQALYEAKLITYPRTDSKYLTEDMEDTVQNVIQKTRETVPFVSTAIAPFETGRIFDNRKVSDHHAIIPTVEIGRDGFDYGSLSENECKVLFMVITRLLCATARPHIYTLKTALIECQGEVFKAQSKQVTETGWKSYEESMKAYCKADAPDAFDAPESEGSKNPQEDGIADAPDAEQASDSFSREAGSGSSQKGNMQTGKKYPEPIEGQTRFADFHEGDVIFSVFSEVTELWTRPPKHFTEDSLLSAMEHAGAKEMDEGVERKGLGTPATRANMIEKLISSGYAIRRKKQILPTDEGKLLIALVPEYLKSAEMTVEWENRLLAMERGQEDPEKFMNDIVAQIMYTLEDCKRIPADVRNQYRSKDMSKTSQSKKPLGNCPICGSPVYEGQKIFFCSDSNCSFSIWKSSRYLEGMRKIISRKMAEDLLSDGRTFVKDLYSKKKDKTFSADLVMTIQDGRPAFSLEFPNQSNER